MNAIIIKTQKELDKLPLDTEGYIYIEGGTSQDPLNLSVNFTRAEIVVRGTAYLENVSGSAQIGSVYGSAQIRYVYDSAQIRYVYDSAQIGSVSGSAQIGSVSGSAQIRYVYDIAQIRYVYGSAQIGSVYGSAQIGYVYDSAQIGSVYGSAQIGSVYDSAQIGSVYGSAQIGSVYDSAQIELFGEAIVANAQRAKKIVCRGYNTVIVHKANKSKLHLVMNKTSHLVILPDNTLKTRPTFEKFCAYYGVVPKAGKAILYKAVHKREGRYFSERNPNFEYVPGEMKTEVCAPASDGSCASGLHISPMYWALQFGANWDDMAIIECEVNVKDIVVASDTDGKVRTSKLKVLREVPPEKYYSFAA